MAKLKRISKCLAIGFISLSAVFVFGPVAIRTAYAAVMDTRDVELLRHRYQALDTAEFRLPESQQVVSHARRIQILRWLKMRGIVIDPGIRDEGVEHAPFVIALFGTTCWAWTDIFHYWSLPNTERTADCLLSNSISDQSGD